MTARVTCPRSSIERIERGSRRWIRRSAQTPRFATAFDGYLAYFGTYAVDESTRTVTHHVVGASFPNWVGVNLARRYAFDESGRLRLATPSIEVGGRALEYVLLWERI